MVLVHLLAVHYQHQHRLPNIKKLFRLVIQNGLTKDQTDDFLQFRQYYCLMWGSIVTIFRMLEKLMYDYAIPIAFINGEK